MKSSKKHHRKHICVLREEGLNDWVRRLSDRPVVECIHCGAKANSLRNICAVRIPELTPENAAAGGREGNSPRPIQNDVPTPFFGAKNVLNRHH